MYVRFALVFRWLEWWKMRISQVSFPPFCVCLCVSLYGKHNRNVCYSSHLDASLFSFLSCTHPVRWFCAVVRCLCDQCNKLITFFPWIVLFIPITLYENWTLAPIFPYFFCCIYQRPLSSSQWDDYYDFAWVFTSLSPFCTCSPMCVCRAWYNIDYRACVIFKHNFVWHLHEQIHGMGCTWNGGKVHSLPDILHFTSPTNNIFMVRNRHCEDFAIFRKYMRSR